MILQFEQKFFAKYKFVSKTSLNLQKLIKVMYCLDKIRIEVDLKASTRWMWSITCVCRVWWISCFNVFLAWHYFQDSYYFPAVYRKRHFNTVREAFCLPVENNGIKLFVPLMCSVTWYCIRAFETFCERWIFTRVKCFYSISPERKGTWPRRK